MRQLLQLFMTKTVPATLQAHRETILHLAAKHGATNLRVFGSMVRGDHHSHSDIDFLVEVQPPCSPWFPAGLVADLEQLLCHPVDIVTEEALHWYIREQILNEAIPL